MVFSLLFKNIFIKYSFVLIFFIKTLKFQKSVLSLIFNFFKKSQRFQKSTFYPRLLKFLQEFYLSLPKKIRDLAKEYFIYQYGSHTMGQFFTNPELS